ncbi:hypothetical protein BN159_2521 [Streptomyces davaonensis JCM 4913]|uniref:Uncharacterized protein n=1 Tax=Streptomyces davaonensis (strain DSM 101723 / JCM 4913 / KCC S-0913 / 768) TaxID=1214101 RepID=K4R1E4_STRDJ|nr:hypothetical protein BN159_2521 [Streptomyces davaonensis JCM 4913]
MNDKAPQQPDPRSAISEPELVGSSLPPMPPVPPAAPLPWGAAPPGRRRRRAFIVGAAIAVLLAGGGIAWWALTGDGDALDHVEVSGGRLVKDDIDMYEECDDTDEYGYNDCDTYGDSAQPTYEFDYKITNKGDEPANYSVIINGFDEDGEFVTQTYIGATHLDPGKSDSDKGQFDDYLPLEDGHELSDIKSVKVGYVDRTALAN